MTQSTISDISTKLLFSHGIEIENHLCIKDTGEILVGDPLIEIWEQMFSKVFEYLSDLKKQKKES